jgi:hypothetical protein
MTSQSMKAISPKKAGQGQGSNEKKREEKDPNVPGAAPTALSGLRRILSV